MTSPKEHRLWYVRRNRDVRGPFPTAVISQFLLLGRLKETDEVSLDRQEWWHIGDVVELQPGVMKADLDDAVKQSNLEAVRRGADERDVGDRRQADDPEHVDRRQGERRAAETEEMLAHRQRRAALRRRETKRKKQWQNIILAVALLVIGVGLLGPIFNYPPRQEEAPIDCNAAAAAGVNWNNCNLQGTMLNGADLSRAHIRNANLSNASLYRAKLPGVDLAYANLGLTNLRMTDLADAILTGATLRGADLRGADLRGADLSYADLQGAQLAGVRLEGAGLSKAIWADGQLCAQGSVGGCVPAAPE